MLPVKLGVRGNHLRLKPDAEFQTDFIHLIDEHLQSAGKFLLVDSPVAETGVVIVAVAEPAVVHDKHLNSRLLRFLRNGNQLFVIKVKVSRLPVVNQNRALPVLIWASDQVLSVEIVQRPAHAAETLCGVG